MALNEGVGEFSATSIKVNRVGRALTGKAVTASAGRLNHDTVIYSNADFVRFVVQPSFAVAVTYQELARIAGLTTEQSPGLVPKPFAGAIKHTFVADRCYHTAKTHAATKPSRAAGILNQAVFLDT